MQDGWISYGPHAKNHETSSPSCNYSTFARAQSLALAIQYGTKAKIKEPQPLQKQNWYRFFPDIKVAVIRTDKIMATVSAYGEIGRYPRASVCRGGSISIFGTMDLARMVLCNLLHLHLIKELNQCICHMRKIYFR